MNYQKHYNILIQRAKEREVNTYTERHHIIPRCLGGKDEKDNLVELTAREHFIANLLLSKIYPNVYGLILAISMMCIQSNNHSNNRINNRMYSWLKEKHSKAMSKMQSGECNSQFGTMWIHNLELKESKKINKDEFLYWKQRDWIEGRIIDFEKHLNKLRNKELKEKTKIEKHLNEIILYNYYYTIYSKVGFDKFVEITNYQYTKQNLVQRFASLVKDFIPQNGKQRKSLN